MLRRNGPTSCAEHAATSTHDLFPANLVGLTNVSHNMDFKQGLYFGKLTGYVTDEDTVNLWVPAPRG